MIYFLVFIVALNFFYASGKLIIDVFFRKYLKEEENKWLKTFVYLLAGISASVFIYSIIISTGITVNILSLIPLGFILYRYPPSIDIKGLRIKSFFNYRINLIAIPVFLIQLVFVLEGFRSLRLDFYPDIDVYAELSYFLNMGFENIYKGLNTVCFDGVTIRTPYHYPELWLCAMLAKTFHISSYSYVLVLVVSPLLFVLTNTGILAIWSHYNNNRVGFWAVLFSFMLMFVGPMHTFFNEDILKFLNSWFNETTIVFENSTHFNHFLLFKYLPFYSLCCLFILLMLRKKHDVATTIMSFSLILNVGLLPGVFAGIFIFCLYLLLTKKCKLKKLIAPLLAYVLLSASFLVFYYVFGQGNQGISGSDAITGSVYKFFHTLNFKGEFARFVIRIFFALVWLLILYVAYVVFLVFTKKNILCSMNKEEKQIIVFAMMVLMIGLLTRPFVQGTNGPQFLSCLLPLVNLSLIVLLIKSFHHYKKTVLFLLFFGLVINFSEFSVYTKEIRVFNKNKFYSQEYVNSLRSELGGQYNTKIAWLADDGLFKNNTPDAWYFSLPAKFLKSLGYYNFYNINNPYTDNYPENTYVAEGSVLDKLRIFKEDKNIKYEELLTGFIDTYAVKYLVAGPGVVLPDVLKDRVGRHIVDSTSKEQFFILKNVRSILPHVNPTNDK